MGQPRFRFQVAQCVVKTGAELMFSLTLLNHLYGTLIATMGD